MKIQRWMPKAGLSGKMALLTAMVLFLGTVLLPVSAMGSEAGAEAGIDISEHAREGFAGVAGLLWDLSADTEREYTEPRDVIVGSPSDKGVQTDNEALLGGEGGIGYHVSIDCTDKSNVVIIGDSRIVAMSYDIGGVSYNATVGAHFLFNQVWVERQVPMVITYGLEQRDASSSKLTGYYAEMVYLVRESIRKHGSCTVVIVSSVNDADYQNWCASETDRMTELGNALRQDGAFGSVKPVVYYVAMVPLEGRFTLENYGDSPQEFNQTLKERLYSTGDGTYIGIGDIADWDGLYTGDGIHFKSEGTQQLFDLIMTSLEG